MMKNLMYFVLKHTVLSPVGHVTVLHVLHISVGELDGL